MNNSRPLLQICVFVIWLQCYLWLLAAPVVGNLSAVQRTGTGFPAVVLSLQTSSDGWDTWTVPVTTATCDICSSVAPDTGKVIVWSKGTVNHAGANYRRSSSNEHNQSPIGSPLQSCVRLSSPTLRQWMALGGMNIRFTI